MYRLILLWGAEESRREPRRPCNGRMRMINLCERESVCACREAHLIKNSTSSSTRGEGVGDAVTVAPGGVWGGQSFWDELTSYCDGNCRRTGRTDERHPSIGGRFGRWEFGAGERVGERGCDNGEGDRRREAAEEGEQEPGVVEGEDGTELEVLFLGVGTHFPPL
jgi:hypothetical protein